MNKNVTQLKPDWLRTRFRLPPPDLMLKRCIDLFFASLGLILFAPLFALVAIAIKLDTPGPVFYHGRRMGRFGKVFLIHKFRTMYETPESYNGPTVTAADDQRVTPFGGWLRATKLNELPQLWNVFTGDMSLVGPRPEDPEIAAMWPPEIKKVILSIRSGMTSPASVHYHNEENLLSCGNLFQTYLDQIVPDKLRLDLMYVRYRNLWLDLDAILWTFLLLLPNIRAFGPPESLLFVGPITRLMRRYINWFILDWMVTFTSISFVAVLWRLTAPFNIGFLRAVGVAFGFALIFSLIGTLFGVNKIAWTKASPEDSYDLFPAWFVSLLIAFTLNQVTKLFPAILIISASILAAIGFIIARYRTRLFLGILTRLKLHRASANIFQERVLIVGSGPSAQFTAWLFSHPLNMHKYKIVGFIDNDLFIQGMRIYGARVIGQVKDLQNLLQHINIDLVTMNETQARAKEYQTVYDACESSFARLVVVPDLLSTLNGMFPISASIPVTGISAEEEQDTSCAHCLLRCAAAVSVTEEIGES